MTFAGEVTGMSKSAMQTRIFLSLSHDPWYNLALEEHLLNQVGENEIYFYLWQNQNTVVIGKHQNAWKECRWDLLSREGGKLARRLSGGGAVYHDLGNLNFTFVMDKKLFNLEKQLQVILTALEKISVPARFSGRNDLLVEDGRKFSGNAFCFRNSQAYHHGTLSIKTDFEQMLRYLQVSQEKIASKGIESVRSRVVNLTEVSRVITVEKMTQALLESFVMIYGGELNKTIIDPLTLPLGELSEKYASWGWIFGQTPSFDISFEQRFPWGGLEIGFILKNGIIQKTAVFSDAMDERLIGEIPRVLTGCRLEKEEVIKRIDEITVNQEGRTVLEDIKSWLGSKVI